MMISHAASGSTHGRAGRKVLVIDARKAHLHAMAGRELYVDLHPEQQVPGMCARLNRSLHGTRDAAIRWEAFLAEQLGVMGFRKSKASPCCYEHKTRDLRCIAHGHDFVFVGPGDELRWAQKQMEANFLVKVIGQLGGDKEDLSELRVLNRVLRWTSREILLEADPQHQDILVWDKPGNAVFTPSIRAELMCDLAHESLNASETRFPIRSCSLQLSRAGSPGHRICCKGTMPKDVGARPRESIVATTPQALPQRQPASRIQLSVAGGVWPRRIRGYRLRRLLGYTTQHLRWCGPTRRPPNQALVQHAQSSDPQFSRGRTLWPCKRHYRGSRDPSMGTRPRPRDEGLDACRLRRGHWHLPEKRHWPSTAPRRGPTLGTRRSAQRGLRTLQSQRESKPCRHPHEEFHSRSSGSQLAYPRPRTRGGPRSFSATRPTPRASTALRK